MKLANGEERTFLNGPAIKEGMPKEAACWPFFGGGGVILLLGNSLQWLKYKASSDAGFLLPSLHVFSFNKFIFNAITV